MKKEKTKKIFGIALWSLFIIPDLTSIIVFILISNGRFGYMPPLEELENPSLNLASELYSDDTTLIGKYFYENRTLVNYTDLSPFLTDALICTEDIRYYKHSGVDVKGVARAIIRGALLRDESAGGGSTITQQLAKLLYTKRSNNTFQRIKQKLNEWVIAAKLEKRYTKEEIIALYLNYFDFLNNSIGIQTASKVYFNTSPDSLKIEQAALLIGMLQNPSLYNPLRFEERSMHRRNIVLSQMVKYGRLSTEFFDSLKHLPLNICYTSEAYSEGTARYFYDNIRLTMTAKEPKRENYYNYNDFLIDSSRWYNDPFYGWCNKNFKPNGSPYNIYTDGLRIYSTLNYQYQQYAENAVRKHIGGYLQKEFFKEKKGRPNAPFAKELTNEEVQNIMNLAIRRSERYRVLKLEGKSDKEIKENFKKPVKMKIFSWEGLKDTVLSPVDSIKYYKHILNTGFISMNPHNGHVKAYVGGIDFRHFKFDNVTNNTRQVGSTIKPFLYTLAMREGYSPCRKVQNVPISFPMSNSDSSWLWEPKNSGLSEWNNKEVTLKFGLANSINWITAWVLKQFNPFAVVDMAHKLGIKSYIEPVYSVILGTSGISLEEMVNAYCVYTNKGVHVDPIYVTKIEDKNGNVLSTFIAKPTEAISENTAYLMLSMLQGVIDAGTGRRLRSTYEFTIPIAGKTGTTQNHSDGWFIGITPDLVSGVWVGCEDRSAHFDYISMGQGANMALPIWALYMKQVIENETSDYYENLEFTEPEGFNIDLDCDDATDPIINSNEEGFEF